MKAKRRAARRLALQRSYKPPEVPAHTRTGSIPPTSAYFALSRLAALSSVSRHQVIGFASSCCAAAQSSSFSASVSGIFMSASRRSSGAFGGRPIFMATNHIHENSEIKSDILLSRQTYCGYNKYVEKKTPEGRQSDRGETETRRFRPV